MPRTCGPCARRPARERTAVSGSHLAPPLMLIRNTRLIPVGTAAPTRQPVHIDVPARPRPDADERIVDGAGSVGESAVAAHLCRMTVSAAFVAGRATSRAV